MCGRFASTLPGQAMLDLFHLTDQLLERPPRPDIAPTEEILAVRRDPATGRRSVAALRWGLIPHWAKDPSCSARLINCRAENIATTFRDAFARRRCLIPASAFYEWGGRPKRPYTARLKDGGLFAFAGLWENWRQPDGSWLRSCSIVTTTANALIAAFHHRMPVILPPADHAAWLGEETATPDDLLALLRPYPAEEMTAEIAGPPRPAEDQQIGLFD